MQFGKPGRVLGELVELEARETEDWGHDAPFVQIPY
jgi:hypothetical protein